MWYINNIRVYVTDYTEGAKQIVARLQPLASHSVNQGFGYESLTYQVVGKVVGTANKDNLMDTVASGIIGFASPYWAGTKSVYVSTIAVKQDNSLWQNIDPLQECDVPVYTVTAELYEEI